MMRLSWKSFAIAAAIVPFAAGAALAEGCFYNTAKAKDLTKLSDVESAEQVKPPMSHATTDVASTLQAEQPAIETGKDS